MVEALKAFLQDGPVELKTTILAMERHTTVLNAMDRFQAFCNGLSPACKEASTDRKKVWFELKDMVRDGIIRIEEVEARPPIAAMVHLQ